MVFKLFDYCFSTCVVITGRFAAFLSRTGVVNFLLPVEQMVHYEFGLRATVDVLR